jgi:hypothetical protein
MPAHTCRFVHTSDWHLERTMWGLAEIPEHLRDVLVEAPRTAASRVIDLALAEQVDFVLLAGDILDPFDAGPRTLHWLGEQLGRLAEAAIPVYWIAGQAEGRFAADSLVLPANVTRVPAGAHKEFPLVRDGLELGELLASGGSKRRIDADGFGSDQRAGVSIAMAHGGSKASMLKESAAGYWALGGKHTRCTLSLGDGRQAHYCGTPQGRHPGETGPCGCTLVEMDRHGRTRLSLCDTDLVRWHVISIARDRSMNRESLEARLRTHLDQLAAEDLSRTHLVRFDVTGEGPCVDQLLDANLRDGLLRSVRSDDTAAGGATVWTTSIEVRPDGIAAASPGDDSLAGDLVRAAHRLLGDNAASLDLAALLGPEARTAAGRGLAEIQDSDVRRQLLAEAVSLGVRLLSGKESTF